MVRSTLSKYRNLLNHCWASPRAFGCLSFFKGKQGPLSPSLPLCCELQYNSPRSLCSVGLGCGRQEEFSFSKAFLATGSESPQSAFIWVLGTRAQVIRLTHQALLLLKPSPWPEKTTFSLLYHFAAIASMAGLHRTELGVQKVRNNVNYPNRGDIGKSHSTQTMTCNSRLKVLYWSYEWLHPSWGLLQIL